MTTLVQINLSKNLKELILGVRIKGERVAMPSLPKERPLDQKDFENWCKHVRFGMLYDRKAVYL